MSKGIVQETGVNHNIMAELEFFESIALVILAVFGSIISGIILQYYRTKSQCFIQMKNMIDKSDKRSFRIAKALVLMAQMIDNQTNNAHDDAHLELEKLTKELLKDSS